MSETLIAEDVTLTGKIASTGDVELKGVINGDIECRNLVIENGAVVEGTANAEKIIIKGQVKGSVNGIRVVLASTAKVDGDLKCKSLFVDEEAHFEGTSQRVDDPLTSVKGKSTKPDKNKANGNVRLLAAAES